MTRRRASLSAGVPRCRGMPTPTGAQYPDRTRLGYRQTRGGDRTMSPAVRRVTRSADSPGAVLVGDDEVGVRARLVELEARERSALEASRAKTDFLTHM